MINIQEVFRAIDDDLDRFNDVTEKLSNRSDLCALLILDRLLPGSGNLICNASHDLIYFGVDMEELAEVATEDDIRNLSRCGVMCDGDGLSMFV